MEDEKKNKLIRRPGSDLSKPGRPANRVREGMTRDALVRAKARDLSAARFRIGEHLLREPDYRQILRWAEAGGMRPEEVLQRLAESVFELTRSKDPNDPLIRFSIEDGALLSVVWDFELLPFIPDSWVFGLLIREFGFYGVGPDAINILRPDLPMLTVLACARGSLERLDLSKVPGLTKLTCLGNKQLTELDLTPVPDLIRLDCRANSLTDLDLTPVPRLTEFICTYNNLSKLDLTPVPGLSKLSIGFQNLTELDLRPVPRLTSLFCGGNNLTELDLTPVPGLTMLDCWENSLTELDITPAPGLTELILENNNLTELDLTPASGLTSLSCSFNNLAELDLTPVPRLTSLFCGGNNFTELDLAPVPGLTMLDCDRELHIRNAPVGLDISYV